ncbi:MAG: oligosaccharide flippase family protein, partial [Armatimonadetes bacterium]|nr:oligosaccharide flippase family protein [Armatimonadota bacterium]
MSENLKALTLRGIFFSGLSSIIIRLLSFFTTLILSRILSPYDFGLMGQGILFINICMILNDLGLSTALVYQKEDLEKSANTALFLVLPAGVFLTILTYFLAPLIAHFFKENSLLEITRILSLTIFISALAGIFNAILNKKMYFKKLLIPEVAPVLLYSFFTILLARLNFGVWSLVYGYFMQVLINFILTYFSSNFKFKLIFDKKSALLMLNYGKEVILTSIIL